MRLLRTDTSEPCLEVFNDSNKIPPYAILSHTWLGEQDEVTFVDLRTARKGSKKPWKLGMYKLDSARKQAASDKFKYIWVDTCCIDKSSSAELAEAINSMYRWYQKAELCYAFLDDMPEPDNEEHLVDGITSATSISDGNSSDMSFEDSGIDVMESVDCFTASRPGPSRLPSFQWPRERRKNLACDQARQPLLASESSNTTINWNWKAFTKCRWFTRGWTLQEMIGPKSVRFYSAKWVYIGGLNDLSQRVAAVTGVHEAVLCGRKAVRSYSVAQRMSWAANRQTTRIEDRAYSLLGIFDISMPIVYGEGDRAFRRLQEELLKASTDQSIFCWSTTAHSTRVELRGRDIENEREILWGLDLLASSPDAFGKSGNIVSSMSREAIRAGREVKDTSSEVQFELPVFDTTGPQKTTYRRVMLSCTLEDNRTQVMVLRLVRVAGDTFIREAHSRIDTFDIYEASSRCTLSTFSVAKMVSDINIEEAPVGGRVLLCRCRLGSRINICEAEPADRWQPASSSFALPEYGVFNATLRLSSGNSYTSLNIKGLYLEGDKEWTWSTSFDNAQSSLSRKNPVVTIERRRLLHEEVYLTEIDMPITNRAARTLRDKIDRKSLQHIRKVRKEIIPVTVTLGLCYLIFVAMPFLIYRSKASDAKTMPRSFIGVIWLAPLITIVTLLVFDFIIHGIDLCSGTPDSKLSLRAESIPLMNMTRPSDPTLWDLSGYTARHQSADGIGEVLCTPAEIG